MISFSLEAFSIAFYLFFLGNGEPATPDSTPRRATPQRRRTFHSPRPQRRDSQRQKAVRTIQREIA